MLGSKLRDLFRAWEKAGGIFFSFALFWTSVCIWAEDFCMIWSFVFPSRAFTLTASPKLPLALRARCFGLPTIRSFQDVNGGSFSCFYLNPLLEHCELPMMLYDLLRASIIFVLLLAPWARVGLKFFFRCDLIRLWAAGAGLLVQSCNCCVWVSFSLQVGP